MKVTELFWRLLPDVRPAERGRFGFFALLFGLVSLACTMGLAAVEALFLTRVGPEDLPLVFLLAAPLTVLGSLGYGAWVGRSRNDHLFTQLLLGSGAVVVVGFAFARAGVSAVFPVLFCFYFLSFSVLRNHYWTFAVDYFDTQASKRLTPLFNVGNSLGGAVGGLGAVGLAWLAPAEWLIAGWALFLALAAAQLRLGYRALRRWGPLELEEADESSLQGLGGAVRYSQRSKIGRWLVASTSGMILALIIGQYVYLSIFAESFDSAESLAVFLGLYLAVTNVIEVLVEAWLLPWMIRRFGVTSSNLAHPALTLASFAALGIQPAFGAALAARVNGELLENAMAGPLRTLVYNAIPLRFRGRIRALLEGIVWYSGMAVAGGILLVAVPRLDLAEIAWLGGVTALVYLIANWRVRRAYLDSLKDQLDDDLETLTVELARLGSRRLLELWKAVLEDPASGGRESELRVADALVKRDVLEPVIEGLAHPDVRVRIACVRALGTSDRPEADAALGDALADTDRHVRVTALAALGGRGGALDEDARVLELLEDPDPAIRAEAAASIGSPGVAVLDAMLSESDPDTVRAALRSASMPSLQLALRHVDSHHTAVRAEAIRAVSRVADPLPLTLDRLERELESEEIAIRRAILEALATFGDRPAQRIAARALADPTWEIRQRAAEILARVAPTDVELLEPYLRAPSLATSEAAARALSENGSKGARALLNAEFSRRVRDSWWALLAIRALPPDASLPERFLAAALEDATARDRVLCFRILERMEDAAVMRTVEKVLRFASARARADALEVISNLGDRETANLFVLLLEDAPLEERVPAVAQEVSPPADTDAVVRATRDTRDPWIRMAVEALRSDGATDARQEEQMDRLLVLRQVGLFAHLPLEQLEAINSVLEEKPYMAGEEICREGDLGTEMYVLVEGTIEAYKQRGTPTERLLSTQTAPDYTGEMAILDDGLRGATLVAATEVRLLALSGQRLNEVILQTPEIAFELCRVLTRRTRRAEELLARAEERVAELDVSASSGDR